MSVTALVRNHAHRARQEICDFLCDMLTAGLDSRGLPCGSADVDVSYEMRGTTMHITATVHPRCVAAVRGSNSRMIEVMRSVGIFIGNSTDVKVAVCSNPVAADGNILSIEKL
jgi:hypothetical protein